MPQIVSIVFWFVAGWILSIPYGWLTSSEMPWVQAQLGMILSLPPAFLFLLLVGLNAYSRWGSRKKGVRLTFWLVLSYVSLPIFMNQGANLARWCGQEGLANFLFAWRFAPIWLVPISLLAFAFLWSGILSIVQKFRGQDNLTAA